MALKTACLNRTPLTEQQIQATYDHPGQLSESDVRALCLSHERLRAELAGAEELIDKPSSRHRDLLYRAVTGLKHIGQFARVCGQDPHPLDCTLAGRVAHVFGVGMTRAIEICREAGQDPEFTTCPLDAKFSLNDRVRIRFGVDRGHYGTVIHVGGDDNNYFGIKLDCASDPAGYSDYELAPA